MNVGKSSLVDGYHRKPQHIRVSEKAVNAYLFLIELHKAA